MMKACAVAVLSFGLVASPVVAAAQIQAAAQLEAIGAAPDSAGGVYDNQAAGRQGAPVDSGTTSIFRPAVETKAGDYYGRHREGFWVEVDPSSFNRGFNGVMRPAYKACASSNGLEILAGVLYGIVMAIPATVVGLCAALVG